MVETIIYPVVASTLTAIVTWLLAYENNKRNLKSVDIDNEMKAALFYKSLLDDAKIQIDHLIEATKERDEKIKERDKKIDQLIEATNERDEKIKERDKNIELLIQQVQILTIELKKYKQLNGKTE